VRLSLTISDAGLVKGLSKLSGWRDIKRQNQGVYHIINPGQKPAQER